MIGVEAGMILAEMEVVVVEIELNFDSDPGLDPAVIASAIVERRLVPPANLRREAEQQLEHYRDCVFVSTSRLIFYVHTHMPPIALMASCGTAKLRRLKSETSVRR